MIALMLALYAGVSSPGPQAVQATLQSCAMEQDRWVCRYQVPNIEIIPFTGDAAALEPTARLGGTPTTPPSDTTGDETGGVEAPAPAEPGILTEREARLVARCADAGWMSLCLPDDRRAARSLRERQSAYQTVQRSVTSLLAEDRCEDAIKAALDGGYLGLARQARDFCAAPSAEPVNVQAVVPPAS